MNAGSRPRRFEVLGTTYEGNPQALVGPEEHAMLRVWAAYHDGHVLPDAGGALQQAAVMLDALHVMSTAADEARAERRALLRQFRGLGGRGH